MAEAHSTARIFLVDQADRAPFLFVEVIIDCPSYGLQRIQVAGHHLRMLRDICIDAIDQHPELTGSEPKKVDLLAFKGRQNDPRTS
jgi:hypothetical protein